MTYGYAATHVEEFVCCACVLCVVASPAAGHDVAWFVALPIVYAVDAGETVCILIAAVVTLVLKHHERKIVADGKSSRSFEAPASALPFHFLELSDPIVFVFSCA
jgi:hypothetical protein